MNSNQFYKGTPFKAGTHKNVEPCLSLQMVGMDEDRKHIHVVTKGGVKLLLSYDGKACCFHLLKYRINGAVGGPVYNNWLLAPCEDMDKLNAASDRW